MHSYEQQDQPLNNFVITTGVSGSGKDFLLSRALKQLPSAANVTQCSFGSALHELILATGPAGYETRDDLCRLSAGLVREFGQQVLKNMMELEGTKILNTHVTYREGQLVVSDPQTDLRLRARDYVFVQADPGEIAARRERDGSRARSPESPAMIAVHQAIALATVAAIVEVTGARLTVLPNTSEDTAANVAALREIIERGSPAEIALGSAALRAQ